VENLEEWGENSPNELHFIRLPYKWSIFHSPQQFLLTDRNRNDFPCANSVANWDSLQKQRLLESYLGDENGGSGGRVPELEGWLLLKMDGKKSWRRHFFVLRASGIYIFLLIFIQVRPQLFLHPIRNIAWAFPPPNLGIPPL